MSEDDGFALDVNDFKESPEVETQDTTPTESSPEETKETVADDLDTDADATEVSGDTETEETDADDTEEKPKAKNSAENRKTQLNQEIRELVATRDRTRREVENLNAQYYKPASTEELVNNGMDASEARFESLKQELALRDYTAQVTETTNAVNTEVLQVFTDFPEFDSESPEYNKTLAERAARAYQRVAGIVEDKNTGHIVSANELPYNFYKDFAETYREAATRGEVSARKNVSRELASAENPVQTAKVQSTRKDAFEEGFDSIS